MSNPSPQVFPASAPRGGVPRAVWIGGGRCNQFGGVSIGIHQPGVCDRIE